MKWNEKERKGRLGQSLGIGSLRKGCSWVIWNQERRAGMDVRCEKEVLILRLKSRGKYVQEME